MPFRLSRSYLRGATVLISAARSAAGRPVSSSVLIASFCPPPAQVDEKYSQRPRTASEPAPGGKSPPPRSGSPATVFSLCLNVQGPSLGSGDPSGTTPGTTLPSRVISQRPPKTASETT